MQRNLLLISGILSLCFFLLPHTPKNVVAFVSLDFKLYFFNSGSPPGSVWLLLSHAVLSECSQASIPGQLRVYLLCFFSGMNLQKWLVPRVLKTIISYIFCFWVFQVEAKFIYLFHPSPKEKPSYHNCSWLFMSLRTSFSTRIILNTGTIPGLFSNIHYNSVEGPAHSRYSSFKKWNK